MKNRTNLFATIVILLGMLLLLIPRLYVQEIYFNRNLILLYIFFILVFTFRSKLTWVLGIGGLVFLLMFALFGGINDSNPTNWTNFLQPIYFAKTRIMFSVLEYILTIWAIVLLFQKKSRIAYGF